MASVGTCDMKRGTKSKTRRRVVEVAAGRFRKHGIESSGVAELMADAGLHTEGSMRTLRRRTH